MNKICLFLGHNRFTGVNTWALTLVNELIKLNYEVDVIFENTNLSFSYVYGYDEFIKKIPTNVYCDKEYSILNHMIHVDYHDKFNIVKSMFDERIKKSILPIAIWAVPGDR